MKKIVLASAFLVVLISCKKETEAEVAVTEPQVEYAVFGDSINTDGALSYQDFEIWRFKSR